MSSRKDVNVKSKEIADRIMAFIKEKGFTEGERLPSERDLAAMFKVSRTTVREALRNISTMGFTETRYGHGTFVKKVNFDSIIDPLSATLNNDVKMLLELLEVRKLLECETARLAAKRINNISKADIKKALEGMKKEVEEGQTGIEGDANFHLAIANAADNGALRTILEMCRDILNSTMKTTLVNKKQRESALSDHRRIANAIFKGDEESAVKEMKAHLETAYNNINLIKDR